MTDDYCKACRKEVANHETVCGLLCDTCYDLVYGDDKLYEVAKKVTLEAGLPYTDPRTGRTTKP